jgi:RNA polymerase sigma factor for flagellar operon FliA
MFSHPSQDGGGFLPPHGEKEDLPPEHGRRAKRKPRGTTGEWVVEAMLRYKKTGCQITMEKLLVHYMGGYVKRLAIRLAANLPSCIEAEDLAQVAYFGLCDCIEKYDPHRNIKFESFAHRRVEGAMKDYLRKEDPASRLARTRSKIISRGMAQFSAEHGRSPTDDELRSLLQLDQHEFSVVMKDVHVPCTVSFHSTDGNASEDLIASVHVELNSKGFLLIDRSDLHRWLFQQLGYYDRLIVTLHYTESLTMLEIGRFMGYSESRVSQRIKHIHALLKTRMIDHPEMTLLMAS